MPDSTILLGLVVAAAIGFAVANGANDAANSIATVIGTRNLSPRAALIMASCCEFAGAATGTAVARTIGKGIVMPEALTMGLILAGVSAIIVWAVFATLNGMPISLTHGLVAGLVGAAFAQSGGLIVNWAVLARVFSAVGIAPVLGLVGGYCVMLAISWLFRRQKPASVRVVFSKLEVVSAGFLAYSHGKNDGQMPIGLIAMGVMAYGGTTEFNIPVWSILVSAAAISFGTLVGGARVIRTIGLRMTTLRPSGGFAAEFAAGSIIEVASHLGIPVSTTHCMSSAIMGVGATKRLSAVRWGIARSIVMTWVLTFPGCAVLGWIFGMLLRPIG
ncbi:MAG: inorganic phosphate transporter [Dehalococcoidia bacterium]|nr:inorganic phosphate transporter [Dehalococcoidia bacterium]